MKKYAISPRYLEWTKYYQKSTAVNGFCNLCKYLHEYKDDELKVVKDINKWWHGGGKCIQDYSLLFLEKDVTGTGLP